MVDCGVKDEAGIKILSQTLHNFGLSFSDIETLFLTHHHADHAGLARFLQQQGAKVMMSAADAESLRDYYLHPETDNERLLLSRRHGVPDDISRASLAAYNYFRNLGEAVTPDITVNDGECISLGGLSFNTVLSPGHTEGHLCLVCEHLKIAFTGDCVISPRATYISGGLSDDTPDLFGEFIVSLRRLRNYSDMLPLSGHGAHQKCLHISASKIEVHLQKELQLVFERLSDIPQSAFSLSTHIAEKRPRFFPQWFAFTQTMAYLRHLVATDRAIEVHTDNSIFYQRSS